MMRRLAIGSTAMLCAFLWSAPVTGAALQAAIDAELDTAKTLYRDGRLSEAIDALKGVVVKLNDLRDARDVQNRTLHLADAHFHLGLAHLAMRNESAAVENFRQAAALDPDRTLDPDIYSPRVISVFARARADVVKSLVEDRRAPAVEERPRPLEGTDLAPLKPASTLLRILPGTKLRVESRGRRFASEGQLLAINEQTLTIGAEDWRLDLPRENLTRVHMVVAQKKHWLTGLWIGAAIGAVAGAFETPGCDADGTCWTRAENIGALSFGFGLIGGLVGALYTTDEWVEVPIGASAHLAPTSQRIAVRFSWRY